MKKHSLLPYATTIAATLLCGHTYANDHLVVTDQAGKTTGFPLGAISGITFDSGAMLVSAGSGQQSFLLSDIDNLKFDNEASATGDITIIPLDEDIVLRVEGTTITASADQPDSAIRLTAYNMQGMPVSQSAGHGYVVLDFSAWPHGIYIVKANNKTIKFTR